MGNLDAALASCTFGFKVFLMGLGACFRLTIASETFGVFACAVDDASFTDRFVVRTEGDKSIFLISEGARRLLQQEVKLPTRMVMCGVVAFQRTGAHHERALPWRLVKLPTRMVMCGVVAFQRTGAHHERALPWRLAQLCASPPQDFNSAQEGLAQLAALGLKRRLACRRSLLRRLLAERELTATEAREAESRGELRGLEALSDDAGLKPGFVALTLLPEEKAVVQSGLGQS
ncbi:hypothetical protein AK812_SmicGene13264 [Symbiodinium microadriaticum]|uniref:Uncharacterized protein n=1 Tax=Symbiodinium microadriaticum TaxID=2951 RepID=A0A1Q9E8K2_SYMMI|nr:hypothetical protein AK812_SmicGene13264 [Symbiodinium microadriaticum]